MRLLCPPGALVSGHTGQAGCSVILFWTLSPHRHDVTCGTLAGIESREPAPSTAPGSPRRAAEPARGRVRRGRKVPAIRPRAEVGLREADRLPPEPDDLSRGRGGGGHLRDPRLHPGAL